MLRVTETDTWTAADREGVISRCDSPPYPPKPPAGLWDEPLPDVDEGEGTGDFMSLLAHPDYQGRVTLEDDVRSSEELQESEGEVLRRGFCLEMWEAAMNGDLATLTDRIVNKSIDVNSRCEEWGDGYVELNDMDWACRNRTAIHFACCSDDYFFNPKIMRALVRLGADVNAQDAFGDTGLHYACRSGNGDILQELISAGADPMIKNYGGKLPVDDPLGRKCLEWEDESRLPTGNHPPDDYDHNHSPPMTPRQVAFCADQWSTARTRMMITFAEEMWVLEGFVRMDVWLERVKAGEIELDKARDAYDEEHGATEEAMTLRTQTTALNGSYHCMPKYDQAKWKRVQELHHFNISEVMERTREEEQKWIEIQAANSTWNDSTTFDPDVYYPYGKPYPNSVPIRARRWAFFSSGEWAHPEFDGEIIYDHMASPDWPQKHHWLKSPEYPEGLWEVHDPILTKGLTEEEQERARIGCAQREEYEKKLFADPEFRKANWMQDAVNEKMYPAGKSDKARKAPYADYGEDPLDEIAREERKRDPELKRPWEDIDAADRARACARLQREKFAAEGHDVTRGAEWWWNITVDRADDVDVQQMTVEPDGTVHEARIPSPFDLHPEMRPTELCSESPYDEREQWAWPWMDPERHID